MSFHVSARVEAGTVERQKIQRAKNKKPVRFFVLIKFIDLESRSYGF
jgi:hypothetical protein